MNAKSVMVAARFHPAEAAELDSIADEWRTQRSGAIRRMVSAEYRRLAARQKRKAKK